MNVFLFLVIVAFLGLAGWFLQRYIQSVLEVRRQEAYKDWLKSRETAVLKILPPKLNEKTPLSAEQLFASLHGIFREEQVFQDQVSFEMAVHNTFIHFYVHVPKYLKDFVEGQIYAQYPSIEVIEVEDYSRIEPQGQAVVAGELSLTKDPYYPIKTFPNFEVDPLSAITGVLGSIGGNDQLWLQVVVKPVAETWQEKGIEFVSKKRLPGDDKSFISSLIANFSSLIGEALRGIFFPKNESSEDSGGGEGADDQRLSSPEEQALKAIEEKITKLGFETKIRIISIAGDPYTARNKIESLSGAFKQFNTTNMNGFKSLILGEQEGLLDLYRQREFYGHDLILNTEELASIYHLPAASVETPNMAWAGSKKGEPPSNLPLEGSVDENEVTFLGKTDFRNFRHKFGIKARDRNLHMYILGKTGTGKSTLMQNMIIDDIHKGRGVAVVDPHGQLVHDILQQIPSHRINDVLYFNPADREFPVGFNVLESVAPDLRNVAASGVVGIFKKLFAESWGPRLEYILRNTILALLEYPGSTLLGINRLLTDKNFRKRVVSKVEDPVIKDYFANEFEQYTPKFRTEAIAPIQNKVGQFLSSTTIRNIIGQPRSSINIRELMDNGKIFLVDLSIGKIGEDSSALLGALLITQIQLTAMQRADVSETERRDFYLYVDEFQNFATDSFAVILSEARKYKLNLTLINQYIAQMPETVAAAIFGNVGTIISFRVGPGDASGLVREFEPVFQANDLVNLANYHIYTKMAIDGVTRPAFSASTLPPQSEPTGNMDKVIAVSRERYSKPRVLVEQKIKEWSEDTQLKQAQEWRKSVRDEGGDNQQEPVSSTTESGQSRGRGEKLPDFIIDASKKLKQKSNRNREEGQGRPRISSKNTLSKSKAQSHSKSKSDLNRLNGKSNKKDVSWFDSGDEISL